MRTWLAVAVLFTAVGPLIGAEAPVCVPKVIASSSSSDTTAWISESLAVDDARNLRSSALDDTFIARLMNAVNVRRRSDESSSSEGADAPCAKSVGRHLEQFGSYDSIRDLTASAHSVFAGTVIASDQGFLYGQPGTLFAISVSGSAKGELRAEDVVYLFYPFARIRLSEGLLCANPGGNPARPAVGEVVVAFPFLPPIGGDSPIFNLDPSRQLIVVRDGRAHLPAALADELEETASAESILLNVQVASRRGERAH